MSQEQGPTVAHGPRVVAGRYAILNELGRGGMGVVWLAEDRMIGRHVAIKELHLPDGVPHSERAIFEERVLREARTAGRLNDPAVVTVYDVVQETGATYIVMELIQAPTLSDVIRERGPLPADLVAKVAEQLLSALDAAHQAGVVHRDVKPSNIMLAANGRVKLTDFGIAQSLDDPRLTASGMLIGSPTYLAPERLRGEEAGASSDLWALGAVLFYAIEGYSPYERTTTAATMHAILSEVPYLTRAQGALASVISGLMVGTPAARLTSAQVRGMLSHVPTGPPTGPTALNAGTAYYPHQHPTTAVPAPPKTKTNFKVLAIGVVVALVLGVVGGVFLNKAMNTPDPVEPILALTYGENGDLPAYEISDGNCGDARLQKGSSYSSYTDCAKPFQVQTFGYLDFPSGATKRAYNAAQIRAIGESYCGWLFTTDRVNRDTKGILRYAVVYPSKDSWDASPSDGRENTLVCALYNKDFSSFTGSQVKADS
ncbi:serine/threonine-protein kinase [Actinokineospora auranticolor]|uniref:non-specific serine/threonine protein kinase n=1 Tax=Actinokineospora auranticolor TaxID=155976 RepID=A0A2S6GQD5_9PSEU|nr:serine/threonine-protein kinase [Actinokineospora auranticolor]PPK67475.1 serine/threonine protein kinase [Actinokineospora auranticolor]